MLFLVHVNFLPRGALTPEEFFKRINARWSCVDIPSGYDNTGTGNDRGEWYRARSGVCIADYDSIQQFTLDLSIMPGAGIYNIEIEPVEESSAYSRN